MPLKVAVQMDPIERINIRGDSTFALLLEAQRRGHAIAYYTPEGSNFYTVAGSDMKKPDIDMVVSMADQTVAEPDTDAPEAFDNIVVVNSPTKEGIVLIRAPLTGPSGSARADQALKAASCGPHSVSR